MKVQKILFYVYWLILILPNCVLAFTERMSGLGKVTLVLLPLAVYGWLMTLRRKPGVMLWWLFPILFLGAFQLVLTYLFGQGVIAVDMWLNLLTTNSGEVSELLSQLLPAIIGVVLLYIPALAVAVWSVRQRACLPVSFIRRNRNVCLGLLPIGLLSLGASYIVGGYRATTDLFPVNVCYNAYLAVERDAASRHYVERTKDFRFHAKATRQDSLPEVVVCVIGETSRAANWALYGYNRPTNPVLSAMSGILVYKDEMSQSNTTHKSVPILLSPASAENYELLYKTKGVLAAYKEAGYYTAFISNQQRNGSFIDFLGEQADECVFVKEENQNEPYDGVLLQRVADVLRLGYGRVFIVLHTYGSHFNYKDRYPADMAAFLPDAIESAEKKYRNELINAYDNSIRYTDAFLGKLINRLNEDERCAALLYTSDHGEDIFDDRRNLFLHASPVPSYYQLHVPLLIWTSDAYRRHNPEEQRMLELHQTASTGSDCVFHTLLGLGGISTPYRNDSLSLTSQMFTEKERHYVNDHNNPLSLHECLSELDLQVMKQKQLKDE